MIELIKGVAQFGEVAAPAVNPLPASIFLTALRRSTDVVDDDSDDWSLLSILLMSVSFMLMVTPIFR